jgi:membrane protein DedA with SNARE-associated domain
MASARSFGSPFAMGSCRSTLHCGAPASLDILIVFVAFTVSKSSPSLSPLPLHAVVIAATVIAVRKQNFFIIGDKVTKSREQNKTNLFIFLPRWSNFAKLLAKLRNIFVLFGCFGRIVYFCSPIDDKNLYKQ